MKHTPPDFDAIAKSITDESWRAYGPTQTQRIAAALRDVWLSAISEKSEVSGTEKRRES